MNDDPLWFKDATFYELHVRSFCDSNADGIGDLMGIVGKLDYLGDLGINTLWLLPFYPSPLKDDGYDVTNHCDVHRDYGSLDDFKVLLKEAHDRGMRVIIELILNHTSDQHPWFDRARSPEAESRHRDYYVWSETPDRYREARVLFPEEKSNWTYDDRAKAYYWHRFHEYQPELNFANAEVQLEMTRIADFWLGLGVDGFRLSCIPFLFEEDGTDCENLPQTHAFVKKLRAHIDGKHGQRVLIAEANLWPEAAAAYFGEGDECHMAFHYSLMPRLFLALRTEDSYPIVDIIEQTPSIPEQSQWALFLRNHDEMGLEMVTEEEKDALLKAYATDPNSKFNAGIRRRLAPLLGNDRRKIELMHALLFSLPGTPVLYYGDEIGMGDNVRLGDRAGVRTPMQWTTGVNAGFSHANPQRLFLPLVDDPVYRQEAVNVETMEVNQASLLWWVKRALAVRKRLPAFGRGDIRFVRSSNAKVLAFARTFGRQSVIVIANLSRFSQAASLDLKDFRDCDITEVFSQNRFPEVGDEAYGITLGPYGYFWLQADRGDIDGQSEGEGALPLLRTAKPWKRFMDDPDERRLLERNILPGFMRKCRWFGGKARAIGTVVTNLAVPVKVGDDMHFLAVFEVHYVQGPPELYFLPLTYVAADSVLEQIDYTLQSVLCKAEAQGQTGLIIDSCYDWRFREFLFSGIRDGIRIKTADGELVFRSGAGAGLGNDPVRSRILKADQSNTAIIFNDQYFLKFYRKVEEEINSDLEIIRFLSEHTDFRNAPGFAGSLEYRDREGSPVVFGLLQEKVDNQGDAWMMTMDSLGRYYERVILGGKEQDFPPLVDRLTLVFAEAPPVMQELIGRGFYERVVRLGQRTAEMHLALASDDKAPAFSPEPFSANYQRSLYSSLRKLMRERFVLLENSLSALPPETRRLARQVLDASPVILELLAGVYKSRIKAMRTRVHGDYHLGQVLFTGGDFVIIDFEGEPGLSFSERRLKKSPLKDVAGMMRSFHYAAYGKILLNENYRQQDLAFLDCAAEQWQHYISRFYLGAYVGRMGAGADLSVEDEVLIRTFLLEKAIYELGYELNARPDWVRIPLEGIYYLVKRYGKGEH